MAQGARRSPCLSVVRVFRTAQSLNQRRAWLIGLGSSCFSEVEFTALCDGLSFDLASCIEDALAPPEVDIGRRQIVQALVIAAVIVVLDEVRDSALQIARQIVVLEQDAA